MHPQGAGHTVDLLIDELAQARGNDTRIIAILWTWLESNLIALGSLCEKPPEILQAALDVVRDDPESYTGITEEILNWIEEAPVRNAAEMLARIALTLGESPTFVVEPAPGVDGVEVLVARRTSELVRRTSKQSSAPTENEHPSLSTLAPSLVVCPRVVNGISLEALQPEGDDWQPTLRLLRRALVQEEPSPLDVHLDTLGGHGLTGWHSEEDHDVGHYDAEEIDPNDEHQCIKAAQSAIRAAAGPCSILVMPELAATPTVLDAIRTTLEEQSEAPALTIVGLYHLIPDDQPLLDSLAGNAPLAKHVNEAVVLGPGGNELWRHRKLSCAQGTVTEGAMRRTLLEDIRLGDTLTFVPTPLGALAVIICLDAFALHSRARVAASPVNVLFVPSLSPHVHRHRDSLQHLVQALWAAGFVCNRAPTFNAGEDGVWNSDEVRSFWTIQRTPLVPAWSMEPSLSRPSFVFKLAEHEPERAT